MTRLLTPPPLSLASLVAKKVTASVTSAYLTVSTSMPLTFTSVSWNEAQSITITGAEDAIQTAESYTATVSHAVSSTDPLFDSDSVVFFPSSEVRKG